MSVPPINILLADDDPDDCLLFKEAVGELSISANITVVHDGVELMSYLKINEHPDVLFLDLNMPRKNGFECLEELCGNDKTKDLSVVVISTSSEEGIIKKLCKEESSFYICKPTHFEKLKTAINEALFHLIPEQLKAAGGQIIFPNRNELLNEN